MSLDQRLAILRSADMLCDESHTAIQAVREYFAHSQGIILTEENAAPFITHLCASLERIQNGEVIEALNEAVYEAARQEPTFPRAAAISRDLLALLPPVPDTELAYIEMHVGVLLAGLEG